MDPLDFLRVANILQNSPGEAEIRTAVGRAYYAVFNHRKIYLAENGIVLPANNQHYKLPKYIRNSGVEEAKIVGQKLADLRDDRVDADYKMDLGGFNAETRDTLVGKARQAVADFQACCGPDLINGVKKYQVICQDRTASPA